VWDGKNVSLYLNGEKVAETPTEGEAISPPKEPARQFFLGADTDSAGEPQFNATGHVAEAGLWSRALTADEITARYAGVFANRTEDQPSVALTSPVPGSELTAPTTLEAYVENEDLVAGGIGYELDGESVAIGDELGPGLAEGEHTVTWSGLDVLGEEITGSAIFTSTSIPTGDGTTQSTEGSSATLTARATSPTGSPLTTTFLEGEVSSAHGTQQGTIPASAFDRENGVAVDVELSDRTDVEDPLHPADGSTIDSPRTTEIPALRTAIPFTEDGQTVLWRGQVDPAREATLLLLNTETGRYEIVDSVRGSSERQVQLSAPATSANAVDGTVKALVLGVDPFADDLDEPVEDSFADPDDFDFSLLHLTDTQYLSEGAAGSDTEEERGVWASAYTDTYDWLAEHGEEHKVKFVAHTGDVIENWNGGATDREVAVKEYEFADGAQQKLEATGIPHSVLPGNHDNLAGADSGADDIWNEYFGPERYEELAQSDSWREEGAEYHPWKEGDNDNSYTLFTAGGQDFVVVSLGYDVTEEEADWARDVFDQYSGRNGILLTHAMLAPSESADGRGADFSHDGAVIDEHVLQQSDNVALVLSGHEHGVAINVRRDVGTGGNNVSELLADYQFYEIPAEQLGLDEIAGYDPDEGLRFGAAYFRLLQFDLDRGEVSVDTYSPFMDDFGATEYDTEGRYDGHEDDFRIPVRFEGRTTSFETDALLGITPTEGVIGEVTHGSEEDASVVWKDLEKDTPYAWFAVTRDVSRAADPEEARKIALRQAQATAPADASSTEEGIVQFGAFTAGGEKTDDEPAPEEPEPEDPENPQPGSPGPDDPDADDPDAGDQGSDEGDEDTAAAEPSTGSSGSNTGNGSGSADGTGSAADVAAASHGNQAAAGGDLARTGFEGAGWFAAAGGLLLAGGGLLLLRRPRA
jgi:hypothetical protein